MTYTKGSNCKFSILISTLLMAGCSWNALYSKPSVAPVHVALSNFEKPHPGKYLLHISSAGLDQNVVVGGLVCTAHDFPVEAARSFSESVQKTLANVVEKIELVSATKTQKQIKAANARALITVMANGLSGHLVVSPGFLTKDSDATIQISARVQVLKPKRRLFNELLSSKESVSRSIGRCLDAHEPVSAASSKALKLLVEKIGNTVSRALSSKK